MSGKLDSTLIPTARDIMWGGNVIRMKERNSNDQERDLEVSKARIAPIRRLNTDILSLVFEMCGEDDWKTPLRIAATCRDWRNLVLATPRAWEFLDVLECEDIVTIKLFLERSHPRPLHLHLADDYASSLLSSISQRLECLTLERFGDDIWALSFPNLKRLVLKHTGDIQTSLVDATRFPALRHLNCKNVFYEALPFRDGDLLNFPPLQSLSFPITGHSHCLSILQACQDTLISLALDIREYPTMINNARLVFPRLICLEIDDWSVDWGEWLLDLKIPVIETYIAFTNQQSGRLIQSEVKTVIQMRVNQVPEASTFPGVKLIQYFDAKEARNLLHHLLSNPAHFVKLETIEVVNQEKVPDDMVNLVTLVNRRRERSISLVFIPEPGYFPGMAETQWCARNMPCYYYPWL